jgi:predicted nicotinamide N-methyase
VNEQTVCIINVKDRASSITNIAKYMQRKAETFRVNFPDYSDKKLYLALAGYLFYSHTEKECINNGIAIIKQVGDTVVINDEHLKTF